jgi:thioredoxin-like negative regulator of GroEL
MVDGEKELVHITAIWCQPCQQMAPEIVRFTEQNPDVKYTKVDLDEDAAEFKKYSEKFGIQSVPTLLGMVDGLFHKGRRGASTKDQIESLFAEIVSKDS